MHLVHICVTFAHLTRTWHVLLWKWHEFLLYLWCSLANILSISNAHSNQIMYLFYQIYAHLHWNVSILLAPLLLSYDLQLNIRNNFGRIAVGGGGFCVAIFNVFSYMSKILFLFGNLLFLKNLRPPPWLKSCVHPCKEALRNKVIDFFIHLGDIHVMFR